MELGVFHLWFQKMTMQNLKFVSNNLFLIMRLKIQFQVYYRITQKIESFIKKSIISMVATNPPIIGPWVTINFLVTFQTLLPVYRNGDIRWYFSEINPYYPSWISPFETLYLVLGDTGWLVVVAFLDKFFEICKFVNNFGIRKIWDSRVHWVYQRL